ncbi:MAG TPA: RsmD family RNA methyltransferase [Patescibacteria group bacterium]|nr:RsmD family RNA methyltransferase [Patescibacteria group bacterium]
MRVIAGVLGGRTFDSPGTNRTHPMSDKARGALFNILGDIHNLTVLDAFAGTGALAFEALSRGAKDAVLLDNDKTAQLAIARNIAMLQLESQAHLVQAAVAVWLRTQRDMQFDLVICDPPYDNLQESLIERLLDSVKDGGLLVLSWPGKIQLPRLLQPLLVEQRSYGDIQLAFYRKNR